MEISIVIPIYNTAKNAIRSLDEVIPALRGKYKDFELLFVIDNTGVEKEIQALTLCKNKFSEIKIYQLNKNYGQHFATLCGYYLAKGDFIVCVDEDMSANIVEVCKTDEYKKFDVFYFYYNKNDMYNSATRKVLSNSYKSIINKVVNLKQHSTFRVISNSLRNKILLDKHIFWNLDVMIFDNTNNIGSTTLYLPDITDEDTGYDYIKLSKIAFEIAYEHNAILMNILFALLPSILFFLVVKSWFVTILFFIVLVIISSAIFRFSRLQTDDTAHKISAAIK